MKRIIISLSLLALIFTAKAQDNGISIQYGMATYNMAGLIEYQNELINAAEVTPIAFSNFPMYTNLKLSYFTTKENNLRLGLIYNFSTTGAHANVSDYSGSYNLDQIFNAHQAGVNVSWPLIMKPKFNFLIYGEPKIGYLINTVTENLTVPSFFYYSSNSLSLNAVNLLTEVGIEANLDLNKVSFGLQGGYLYDVGAKYNYKSSNLSENDLHLIPSKDIKSQISGLRFGLKVIFWIFPEANTIQPE